jgi:hypothetical protein
MGSRTLFGVSTPSGFLEHVMLKGQIFSRQILLGTLVFASAALLAVLILLVFLSVSPPACIGGVFLDQ